MSTLVHRKAVGYLKLGNLQNAWPARLQAGVQQANYMMVMLCCWPRHTMPTEAQPTGKQCSNLSERHMLPLKSNERGCRNAQCSLCSATLNTF